MTYPKEALAVYGPVRKATCFVMMPFAPRFGPVYRRIKETLQSPPLNIRCSRADDIRKPNIIDTILREIATSEYVVADLTGLNPNVFYELGIAHSAKSATNVVLLTQDVGEVPFDLRQLRCIPYGHSAAGMRALKMELVRTFQQASTDSYRFRLKEGQTFTLDSRLTGRGRNLFELSFECVYLGRDGAKLVVRYNVRSLDEGSGEIEPEGFYIGINSPPRRLEQVPWLLHIVESADDGALLVLEKAGEAPIMDSAT